MFIKNTDVADEMFFRDAVKASDSFRSIIEKGNERNGSFEEVSADVFSALYKSNPQVASANKIPRGLGLAFDAFNRLTNLDEFKQIRETAKLNKFISSLASQEMAAKLMEFFPNTNGMTAEELEEELNNLKPQNGGGANNAKEIRKIEEALSKCDKADALAGKINETDMRLKLRAMLNNAMQEAEEAQEVMSNLGIGSEDSTSEENVSIEQKMAIAKRIRGSHKLKKIMEIAGKFRVIAKKKQKEKDINCELSDIERGDTISRIVPSELMLLKKHSARKLFMKNLLEKSLVQYKLGGKTPKGQGPIIVCLDSTGSMSGAPENMSKAIALVLLEVARKEKRDFAIINFGFDNSSLRTFFAPKGKCDYLELLCELEFFMNAGGTNFIPPLEKSIELIKGSVFNKADIIFITDDAGHITDSFIAEYKKIKAEKEFSCFGIGIGVQSVTLDRFCDSSITVDDVFADIAKDSAAQQKVFGI